MASLPSDADLRREMEKLVPQVDVDTITTKQFIALLSKKMGGADLSQRKKYIKMNLGEIIDAMEDDKQEEEEEEEESSAAESEEESEEEEPPKKKAKKGGGGGGGRGGLTEVKEISKTLADFLGRGDRMARTEVVKSLWAYIREHNLQNPKDRREIVLDDAMREVFGVDRFSMFHMNKYVGAHIYPFKPVDFTAPAKGGKKPKKKKASPKKKQKGKATKKRTNTAFQMPFRLSPELASVVGTDILPRPQVTKGLWEYIRKNNMQNPEDKRQIICDKAFRKVMGGEKTVTMFTMNKYISRHLIEKVDPSLYTPNEVEKPEAPEASEDDASQSEDDESSEAKSSSSSSESEEESESEDDDDDEST